MTIKDIYKNKWVRFGFWAVLYLLWVIWIQNYWWLFGLAVIFDIFITRKVKWAFWKKNYKEGEKRNVWLDWLDAIIFAVVVVTFINIFFFQAFKIPSSSMESSLMTGDYLFVSKVAYGPKLPQTPISVPFVHNILPISQKESYSTAWRFGYKRIKGFRDVRRDDYVVFSFPHGDTVLTKARSEDYYTHVRMNGREYTIKTFGPVIVRPVDKKDHYVKRCVAIAGDSLQVIDGVVTVNGVAQQSYPGIQNTYSVIT
ncbi:MAG: signal peptidase I, partial [Bacteroidales bacterium]